MNSLAELVNFKLEAQLAAAAASGCGFVGINTPVHIQAALRNWPGWGMQLSNYYECGDPRAVEAMVSILRRGAVGTESIWPLVDDMVVEPKAEHR